LAVGVLSCGNPRNPAAGTVVTTVDTSGAFITVTNSGDPPRFRLDHIMTVGSEGDGEAAVRRPSSVVSDGEGGIYIADPGTYGIVVFDGSGDFVRRIGGQGRGPTEFQDLNSLAWLGNTLAALDPGNSRITLFGRSGAWLGSWAVPPLTGPDVRLFPLDSASFVSPFLAPGSLSLVPAGVRYTSAGARDTLPVRLPPFPDERVYCRGGDGRVVVLTPPFATTVIQGWVAPGWSLAAQTGQYRILLSSPTSDTAVSIRREINPVPITDSEWESALEGWKDRRELLGVGNCGTMTNRRPEARPLFRSVATDDFGWLWVERAIANGFEFDVYSPDGDLVASVEAPERDPDIPVFVRGDRLYAAQSDRGGFVVSAFEIEGFGAIRR
ncbi:MAG: 6-bladed beta-propeller, partial [Gemmatimonadales bacterium]